jgi:DNA-binding transcriptional regulator PaaX
MAQQTAVEWIFDQLPEHLRLSENGFDMLQQAKEMFQQQIEDAWKDGWQTLIYSEHMEEQYYTQTYTTRLQNETN